MFQCLDCNYKSNRKYNLQLHYKNKHKKEVKAGELERTTNVNNLAGNVNNLAGNVNQKNNIEIENLNFVCKKCHKSFSRAYGLNKHLESCNGIIDNLECQYCHKIFASRQTKSKHIKICKIKQAQIIIRENEEEVRNNITTLNQQQNNMVINYNFYNGKNLIDYESDDDKYDITKICNFGEERTEYIGDDMMKRMALQLNVRKLIELKHFNKEHPENHNIRKNDDKSLKVLINNEWKVESKNEIMNQIFNKSKAELYLCSLEKLFNKELGEMATDEKISQWLEYEKKSKKKVIEFIEIQITEILKKRRKELGLMLEEKRLIGM